MSPARRLALVIARNSFRLVLLAILTLYAFMVTFGTSVAIKSSLAESKAYERIISAVLESNAKQDPRGIFADSKVREITTTAFPPSFVKEESDTFIDAMYAWVTGQNQMISFTVDISQQRVQLAEALSIYGIERLSGLPTCTAFELDLELDPFKATCQPAGINYKNEQKSLEQSLLSSKDFLEKTAYTAQDLPKSKTGQTVDVAYSAAPLFYDMMRPLFFALIFLLILLSAALVLLRPVRRNGWKDLGKALVYSSVVLAVSAAIFGIFVPQITRKYQSQLFSNGTDVLAADVMTRISVHFQTAFINAAIVFALIGAAILLLVKFAPKGSRYKKLEHVTGIANAIAPKRKTTQRDSRAISAPVVTSERTKKRGTIKKTSKTKSRIKREIT